MQSTADQILLELKTRGPAKTRELAARTGITRQAARAQLERLAADLSGGARDERPTGSAGRAGSGR